MIRLDNITKHYCGDNYRTIALDEVCLEIKKGEMVSVMGESGSGKSTLLHIMGFLDSPTTGEYCFLGENVSTLSEKKRWKYRRDHIGFVFQDFALIETITAGQNIAIPLEAKNIKSKDIKIRVSSVMEKLHISELYGKYPPQISGGQRQRVAIARAIVTDPDVILADEPTGALDHQTGMEVMKLLCDLHEEGHTIVIVTHDINIAKLTERIIRLKEGRVI